MRVTLLVVLVVLLSACSVFDRGADGRWVFDEGVVDGQQIGPTAEARVVLDVSSGAVSGTGGCNTYGVEADVYAGAFTLYPDRQITEMECGAAVMNAESAYWNALQRASIYRIDGEVLELEGEDVILRFHRG